MSSAARILVIDDDEPIRATIALFLDDEGYTPIEAADGAEALALLANDRSAVILVDMRMPGMDGVEFARRYRQLPPPHAPIILFTAANTVPKAAEGEFAAVLAKPFELRDLLALIQRLVGA